MSVKTIENVLIESLKNDTPEIITLKGDWGVGKTYFWKNIIKNNNKKIKPEKYCYLSLFGISSMSELKKSILGNIQHTELIGEPRNFNAYNYKWGKIFKDKLRSFTKFIDRIKKRKISFSLRHRPWD